MLRPETDGDAVIPPSYYAERFMTEFNENTQIFTQFLLPWVNEIALAIPVIYQHRGRISFLSGTLYQYRNQIQALETRANVLESQVNSESTLDSNDMASCLDGDGPC